MAVYKHVKRAAPFRSKTFNDTHDLMVGSNGVLSGGAVSTSGDVVTIQPLNFIQEGQIVEVTHTLTVALPDNLIAPYFVAVTSTTTIENLSEVITPTFVKRPQDFTTRTVLVAEWDGQEWRQLPYLDNKKIIEREDLRSKKNLLAGVASGLNVTQTETSIVVAPGSGHTTEGNLVVKNRPTPLPKVAADSTYDRIDEIVLRKPTDSHCRVATISYVVGPTFSSDGSVDHGDIKTISSAGNSSPAKIVNDTDNDFVTLVFIDDVGGSNNLILHARDNNLDSAASPVTLATGVDAFDICYRDGLIHIVYAVDTKIYYMRTNFSGVTNLSAFEVYDGVTQPVDNPRVAIIPEGSSYRAHIVFERRVGPTHRQLWYSRIASAGAVITNPGILVDLSANLVNPSLASDNDDCTFYLAFENSTSGRVYLRTYDASTPSLTEMPAQIEAPLELQDNTYDISSEASLSSTGAKNPVVKRTANKETFVFWLHPRGGGNFGIAAYHRSYLDTFGRKAIVQDVYATSENVTVFDVSVDGRNVAHFIVSNPSGTLGIANVILETLAVAQRSEVLASAGTGASTFFMSRGALAHTYATAAALSAVRTTAGPKTAMRDYYLPPTDAYLAHYRKSDEALSVAGTALEEDLTIRRLYEFNNMFPKTGTVTWGGSADNTLSIIAPITINFLNRLSTYTIPANTPDGVEIPDGSVLYVSMPDEDTPTSLEVQIAEFGTGMLDRTGRLAVPLFWAVDGALYTKFAPFRLDEGGQTVIIGQGLSENAKAWLGLPNENPDPENHNYSSTSAIQNNDDYNTALGKLDERVSLILNSVITGIKSVPPDATEDTIPLDVSRPDDTYRVVVDFENLVDEDPQFQVPTVTSKTTSQFTVKWNAPTDTGNYRLVWQLIDAGHTAGLEDLSNGQDVVEVTFDAARGTAAYRLQLTMENQDDSATQFLYAIITEKLATGFTIKLSAPVDSDNYKLNWVLYDA